MPYNENVFIFNFFVLNTMLGALFSSRNIV